MGTPDVNALGDYLTAAGLLDEWRAYYDIEPWDVRVNSAAIQSVIVDSTNDIISTLAGQEKPAPRSKLHDLMLGWLPRRNKKKKKRQAPAEMLDAFARRFGDQFNADN